MITISQNQFAFTTINSHSSVIETTNVYRDFVATITKAGSWAAMVRVGAHTQMNSVDIVLEKVKEMNEGSFDGLKTALVGGDSYYGDRVSQLFAEKLEPLYPSLYGPNWFYKTITIDSQDGRTIIKAVEYPAYGTLAHKKCGGAPRTDEAADVFVKDSELIPLGDALFSSMDEEEKLG